MAIYASTYDNASTYEVASTYDVASTYNVAYIYIARQPCRYGYIAIKSWLCCLTMYHFQASTMAREPCMYGYIATNSWLCGWTIQQFLVGAIWPCNLGYIVTRYIARNTWLYSCIAIQPCITGYIAMYTWLYSSQPDSHVYMAIQLTTIQLMNSLEFLPLYRKYCQQRKKYIYSIHMHTTHTYLREGEVGTISYS